MKTYESIKTASQVKEGDTLVEFCPQSNDVWHRFTVTEVKANGIELLCPSRALIFVSNEKLSADNEYFKRVF